MADVREIAHVSAYVDGETATVDNRIIASVSAYVDGETATADRRIVAHVSAYICEVTPITSPLILYGVQFVDDDGNLTDVMGTPLQGDRSAWDTDDFADLHAKDISDNLPVYHLPTDDRTSGDIALWNGEKWYATSLLQYILDVLTDQGLI